MYSPRVRSRTSERAGFSRAYAPYGRAADSARSARGEGGRARTTLSRRWPRDRGRFGTGGRTALSSIGPRRVEPPNPHSAGEASSSPTSPRPGDSSGTYHAAALDFGNAVFQRIWRPPPPRVSWLAGVYEQFLVCRHSATFDGEFPYPTRTRRFLGPIDGGDSIVPERFMRGLDIIAVAWPEALTALSGEIATTFPAGLTFRKS